MSKVKNKAPKPYTYDLSAKKTLNFGVKSKYYYKAYVQSLFKNIKFKRSKRQFDIVLISSPKSIGWILDAICREIVRYWPHKKTAIFYGKGDLPKARVYFFSHYSMIKHNFIKYP